jgi:hypothetical protein
VSDVIVIFQHGKELRVIRNGEALIVSHGICAKHKAEIIDSPRQRVTRLESRTL